MHAMWTQAVGIAQYMKGGSAVSILEWGFKDCFDEVADVCSVLTVALVIALYVHATIVSTEEKKIMEAKLRQRGGPPACPVQ